jgi:hypothetical protein
MNRLLIGIAVGIDALKIIPYHRRYDTSVDHLFPRSDNDIDEIISKRKGAVFDTAAARCAGEQDLLETLTIRYLIVEPCPYQPHPPAGGIGIKPKLSVRGTINGTIVRGEFAETAPKTPMKYLFVFHLSDLPVSRIHDAMGV